MAETAVQITTSVRAIERNAQRQGASVALITELERRASDIGEITRSVSRISDQTNLLALNAAIEAARAGDQGRGFAVVADEVRALAETSEKSAQDVQKLADAIQADVREVAAALQKAAETAVERSESRPARSITTLGCAARGHADDRRRQRGDARPPRSKPSARRGEAQKGAEQVASAAEEQSAAANEAQTAIQQQAKSLDQGQMAAQALALRRRKSASGPAARRVAAEQIGATAEELSATIQELSSAAQQIMAALGQINRGAQQQAAATQQTSAALTQIEKSARTGADQRQARPTSASSKMARGPEGQRHAPSRSW